MSIVESSGGQYHVLLIIADGQVTKSVDTRNGEFSEHERKTMEAIGKARLAIGSLVLKHQYVKLRGCDASILLDNAQKSTEKYAEASKTLRCIEIIDEIKASLEEKCPKTGQSENINRAEERSNLPDPTADRWSEVGARVSPLVAVHKRARGGALFLLKDQTTGGTMERGADLEEKRNGELIGSIERVE
ncbi:E3 ubiquitin-protein ligase RGLG2 [Carex littledalei]|uniref:E3 ubiquitin-protein ligase RGLG2 n=1 Tax=Carex littledalei TaxID=544730 RepID=A0A833RLZ2_9POAL|nr:E3 ubiquitin-protein ligase RGLG2 [Carex littledalei]